jgi:hypothetical protein
MNANLRGDVRVKGMPIEDYIKVVASGMLKSLDTKAVNEKTLDVDIDAIVAKKMQPLDAFQDEKKILSDALAALLERITKLEAAVKKAPQTPQGAPPVDLKPDIEALSASVQKLERKLLVDMKPRRGVDQATLDTAVTEIHKNINSKIEEVSTALGQLRKELEE